MAQTGGSKLQDLLNNLEVICEELKTDHCLKRDVPPESFCKEKFWKNIVESSIRVSLEATKLSLAFSKPPLPDATSLESMCRSTEMSCLALISTLYKLPEKQGNILRHQLRADVSAIFRSLCFLVTEMMDCKKKGKGLPQVTQNVWDNCQKLESAPQDNKTAALMQISSYSSLIKDAQQELDEEIRKDLNKVQVQEDDDDNDGEEDEFGGNWSGSELDVAKSALGLVKTAQTCARKAYQTVLSNAKSDELQDELDDIATSVEASSHAIDDFIASLYMPMNKLEVMKMADKVSYHLQSVLASLRKSHCYTDADASWWSFLYEAIAHNLKKVEDLTGKRMG